MTAARSCSRTGCGKPGTSFAPVWGEVFDYETAAVREDWSDVRFCPEHQAEAISEAIRIRDAQLIRPYPRMWSWTFETFPAADPAGAAAKAKAQRWLAECGEGIGPLLIHGPVGTGKTSLAVCCLRAGIALYPCDEVRFCNVRQLLAQLRRSYTTGSAGDPIKDLADAEMLALDDLGAERITDWTLDTIATLIEDRYVRELSTIVTSNYWPSELAERFGHDDLVIGERIVSRLTEDAMQIRLDRQNLRVSQPDPAAERQVEDGRELPLVEGDS